MGNLTHTVSGEIANFKSAARVPIESLKCHFKPKQDLHGYDRPWPAGGGKNLFDESTIIYGTWTAADGTVTAVNSGCRTVDIAVTSGEIYTAMYKGEQPYSGSLIELDENKNFILRTHRAWKGASTPTVLSVTLNENTKYIYLQVYHADATQITPEVLATYKMQLEKGNSSTSYEPYENICPIEGWTGINITKTNKNIARITGYGAQNGNSVNSGFSLTNIYGTTINTTSFIMPDSPMIVTQSKWPNTSTIYSYTNGYITVFVDNLQFNNYYDVSFKISNITNNPLNVSLSSIQLLVPAGNSHSPSKIVGNILIYKNIKWRPYAYNANRSNFEIRNCGMSFTLSEFMVTPTGMSDGIFEPYCGEQIPITFPNISKNLFELVPLSYDDWTGEGYSNTYLYNMNPQINIANNSITVTCQASGDTILYRKTHYYPGTYTLSYDMTYSSGHTGTPVKRMVIMCFKEDGTIMTNEEVSIPNLTWNKYYKGFFNTPGTFTVPNTVSYFTICFGIAGDTKNETATFSNIQLEYGSTATTYEPYSFNNTIYGGYIDIIKGELMPTWACYTITGDESFIDGGNGQVSVFVPTGMQASNEISLRQVGHCTHYPYKAYTKKAIDVMYNERTITFDASIQDAAGWKAFCKAEYEKGTPVQICYPLKSYSQSIPIKKNNITTFINTNNAWSNTNLNTEVSYAIYDTASIRAAKKRMAAENDKHYRKVLWNQWAPVVNADNYKAYNSTNITMTVEDDVIVQVWNKVVSNYEASICTTNGWQKTHIVGRKYYLSYEYCTDFEGYIGGTVGGQSAYSSTLTEKNVWNRFSCMIIRSDGGILNNNVVYMGRFNNATSIEIGSKCLLRNPIAIDITQMFGKGNEPKNSIEFERLCAINNIDLYSYHPRDTGTEQMWCIPHATSDEYIKVNWNQQCKELTTSNYKPQNSNYASISAENGIMTTTILQDVSEIYQSSFISNYSIEWDSTHQYYYKQEINSSTNSTYYLIYRSRRGSSQTLLSNTWTTLEAIASPESTDSTPIFLAYNVDKAIGGVAGASCQVRNPILIDLTKMFGAGNEPTTVAELRATCLKNNINLDNAQPYISSTTIMWKK